MIFSSPGLERAPHPKHTMRTLPLPASPASSPTGPNSAAPINAAPPPKPWPLAVRLVLLHFGHAGVGSLTVISLWALNR